MLLFYLQPCAVILVNSIKYHQSALTIRQEIGDRNGEAISLSDLGKNYSMLGESYKAIECYEKALDINGDLEDRRSECSNLDNLGFQFIELSSFKEASDKFNSAIGIANEISRLETQSIARFGLGQTYLFQNDLVSARTAIEDALQYDVPENNYNASALHGLIVLQQGDKATARKAFARTIGQVDEIFTKAPEYFDAPDAKGLAFCGLAICEDKKQIKNAIESFHVARKVSPHTGIVKSVLRLFDELAKCDTEGILKDVRPAVEGKEPPSRPSPEAGEGE